MSYDIRICVKVDGIDKYAEIARPEYDSPTYDYLVKHIEVIVPTKHNTMQRR